MVANYTCPVCGYPELDEPPYDWTGWGSFDICPSCGIEFGYDSANRYAEMAREGLCEMVWPQAELDTLHTELRAKWVAGGMKWWSTHNQPPANWNPELQLLNLGESK